MAEGCCEGEGDGALDEGVKLELEEVLDDLCSRFLLSLPESEFNSFERLFFAIEGAFWYYEDFYRENDPSLPSMNLKEFAFCLFGHTPLLQPHVESFPQLFDAFRAYKQEVPSCGAALMNADMTKVVLVLSWGNKAKWGFPRGKLSKDESEIDCARREVYEETGYDCGPLLRDSDFIDATIQARKTRIYMAVGVDETFEFAPRTRKEIAEIRWHSLASLPEDNSSSSASKMWGVAPFAKKLKYWVERRRNPGGRGKKDKGGVPNDDAPRRTTPYKKTKAGQGQAGAKTRNKDELTFGPGKSKGLSQKERNAIFDAYLTSVEARAEQAAREEFDKSHREEVKINSRNSLTFQEQSAVTAESTEGAFVSGIFVDESRSFSPIRSNSWTALKSGRTRISSLGRSAVDPMLDFKFDYEKIMACFRAVDAAD